LLHLEPLLIWILKALIKVDLQTVSKLYYFMGHTNKLLTNSIFQFQNS